MPFERDFSMQRYFMDEIKALLGRCLIGEAPAEEDRHHNTDFMVLDLKPLRVACRIRRHSHIVRYGDQFTIRTKRHSGRETELAKVLDGWGDYIFYGFAGPTNDFLCRWFLGDLNVFRSWYSTELMRDPSKTPGIAKSNRDGSSDFAAFELAEMTSGFIVARYDNRWMAA